MGPILPTAAWTLPYFDIVAIQKIEGKKKPTNNAIAHKIFPDEFEVDIVERTRKVTEKKFKYLFTQKVVSQLELQAGSSALKPE
jgi:hypothetical protein